MKSLKRGNDANSAIEFYIGGMDLAKSGTSDEKRLFLVDLSSHLSG